MALTTDRTSGSGTAANSSEESESRSVLGLTVPQVVGTALAAATSALAASFLGVAGTLIGAVVGSLVATIGGAVYSHSLGLAAMQLRVVRVGERTGAAGGADAGSLKHVVTESDPRSDERPGSREPAPRRWLRLAAAVALGAVIAIAGITAFELIIGRPVSGSTSSGTSIGQAVTAPRSDTSSNVATPTSTATTSSATSATPTPTPSATQSASSAPATTATAPVAPTGSGATEGATSSATASN